MLFRIISIILLLTNTNILLGCGCGGPINSIEVDIDSSDAIFLGVITEINRDHNFHLTDQIGNGLKYINFDVYRSNKGLNKAQLKVSVFDFMSNSSCEGLIYDKHIGDTILVFSTEFNNQMLGSYLCGRHPKTSNLSSEEQIFKDTATWIDPRRKYKDADEFINKQFPKAKQIIKAPKTIKNDVKWWLYLSLAINLALLIFILNKEKKR